MTLLDVDKNSVGRNDPDVNADDVLNGFKGRSTEQKIVPAADSTDSGLRVLATGSVTILDDDLVAQTVGFLGTATINLDDFGLGNTVPEIEMVQGYVQSLGGGDFYTENKCVPYTSINTSTGNVQESAYFYTSWEYHDFKDDVTSGTTFVTIVLFTRSLFGGSAAGRTFYYKIKSSAFPV